MKILITGFDPFGGEAINPSFEAVKALPDEIYGAEIIKLELPTAFSQVGNALISALEEVQPQIVLCVGQAGGRKEISLERVAINVMDASRPDNLGAQPVDVPVMENGPAAYFSTLPVKKLAAALEEQGIPAKVSNTAGTFVCNMTMYALLHWIHENAPETLGGFIHVPYIPEQAAGKDPAPPTMDLAAITKALNIIVETLL